MDKNIYIKNMGLLTRKYGEWPTFHDAEVLSCNLQRKDVSLVLEIYVFQTVKDSSEELMKKNECILKIKFYELEDLVIENFNLQNVLGSMEISQVDEAKFKIVLRSLYGLSGEFLCRSIELLTVDWDYPKILNN